MTFILGREPSQMGALGGRFRIAQLPQKQMFYLGTEGSVPKSVSREHCKLEVDEDGNCQIVNLNPENVTYVNGLEVLQKKVTTADRIELGSDKYRVSLADILEAIDEVLVKTVSIEHLQPIWNSFDRELKAIRRREKEEQVNASIPGLITTASVVCGVLPFIPIIVRVVLVCIGFPIAIYFFVKRKKNIDKFNVETEQLKGKFHDEYVCPRCGKFFGFIDYKDLVWQKGCGCCHSKFKERPE